jgi:hypothetical protein
MLLRIMIEEACKRHWTYAAALAAGGVGALGQALLLRHELVLSYPYKIMSSPSADFYAGVGTAGLLVAPALAVIVTRLAKPLPLWSVPASAAVLCPVFFWAVYKAAFLLRWLGGAGGGRNFDGTTPGAVEGAFINNALSLSFAGLCMGLTCGLALWTVFKLR